MKPGLVILLVEDEALIAMDLRIRLLKEGAGRVEIIATGEEAIARVEKERFDLVIMDDHLAGDMRGIEAAGLIRAVSAVPIIFVSGYPKDETFLAAITPLQPATFLDKPVDFGKLLAEIDSLRE